MPLACLFHTDHLKKKGDSNGPHSLLTSHLLVSTYSLGAPPIWLPERHGVPLSSGSVNIIDSLISHAFLNVISVDILK